MIRLSDNGLAVINQVAMMYDIKSQQEALERTLNEYNNLRLYLDYFLKHKDPKTEDPRCLRRYIKDGIYKCALHAPKVYPLETLDICQCCKLKVIVDAWKKPTLEEPPLASAGSSEPQDIRPKKFEVRQTYCYDGGLWVFKSACDVCQHPCKQKENFT